MEKLLDLLKLIYKNVSPFQRKTVENQQVSEAIGWEPQPIGGFLEKTDPIALPEGVDPLALKNKPLITEPTAIYVWGNNRVQINYGDQVLGKDLLLPSVYEFLKDHYLTIAKNSIINYQDESTIDEDVDIDATIFNIIKKNGFVLTDIQTEKISRVITARQIRLPHQFKQIKPQKPILDYKPLSKVQPLKPWRSIPRPRPLKASLKIAASFHADFLTPTGDDSEYTKDIKQFIRNSASKLFVLPSGRRLHHEFPRQAEKTKYFSKNSDVQEMFELYELEFFKELESLYPELLSSGILKQDARTDSTLYRPDTEEDANAVAQFYIQKFNLPQDFVQQEVLLTEEESQDLKNLIDVDQENFR